MNIKKVESDREQFIELLLLADPSEKAIRMYMNSCILFVAWENGVAVGVLALEGLEENVYEIKNVAVQESSQGKGFGKALVNQAIAYGQEHQARKMIVATGNSSIDNLAFYQKLGFRMKKIVANFFLENYSEPIWENGIQCTDLIEMEKQLA